ncbi:MAG: DUF2786 domain-containing protein [Acidimicrobiales bacterium]|nr:DUF2786 domain-containing protein [Acidimicrobiales bacterium]
MSIPGPGDPHDHDPAARAAERHRKAATVRGLLAKAESCAAQFPDEALALVAKAQELMARYRIDDALLAGGPPDDRVVEVNVEVGAGPYVLARLRLLAVVAAANGVRLLTSRGWEGRIGHLIGHRGDVERAEALFTSLLTQSAAEALAAPPRPGAPAATVRWRRAFLFAYADEVGTALRQAEERAVAAAEAAPPQAGTPSVALVLADRGARVDAWVRDRYGRPGSMRPPRALTDPAGARAGREAARRADLGRPGVEGRRAALGR